MPQPGITQIGLRYGVSTAVILVAYSLTLQLTGYEDNAMLGFLVFVILGLAIFLAHKAFKDQGDGYLGYGQGWRLGAFMSAFTGTITGTFTFIYLKLIDKEAIYLLVEQTRIGLEQQDMDDESIDRFMDLFEQFLTPILMGFADFLGMVILGSLLSLVIAAITKNERSEIEF